MAQDAHFTKSALPDGVRAVPGQGRGRAAVAAVKAAVFVLEDAHARGVVVGAVGEELVDEHALGLEAQLGIDVDGAHVLVVHHEVELVEVERVEGVGHGQLGRRRGKAVVLPGRVDDDLELGPAVDVVDLHQLHQAHILALMVHDEAALALVMDVLVVQVLQFHEGLVGLFEPVAHDVGVVVQAVHELEVFPFQRPDANGGRCFPASFHAETPCRVPQGQGLRERRFSARFPANSTNNEDAMPKDPTPRRKARLGSVLAHRQPDLTLVSDRGTTSGSGK